MESLGFHWPSLIVYLVNFLIVLGVLYRMGYKPILRMLDERSKRIETSLAAAEKASKESAHSQDHIHGLDHPKDKKATSSKKKSQTSAKK